MNIKQGVLLVAIMTLLVSACNNNVSTSDEGELKTEQQNTSGNDAKTVTLPSFNLMDVNGNIVALENLKGKKVFVNLWASWCPPCKREMPSIEKLYQSVDTSKVAFVMLSLDDDFEKAKKYATSKDLQLPIYYPAQNLPALFNVQGIPATFIFNEQGSLIKHIEGSDDYDSDMYRSLLK